MVSGICLSFCLLAALRKKNYLSYLHENFFRDISLDEEEVIRFWKLSTSGL